MTHISRINYRRGVYTNAMLNAIFRNEKAESVTKFLLLRSQP
jgi:hypothetical protein